MTGLNDLEKAERNIDYRRGLRDGLILKEKQTEFLKNTTLKSMKWKKNRKKYDELFNLKYYG